MRSGSRQVVLPADERRDARGQGGTGRAGGDDEVEGRVLRIYAAEQTAR